VRVVASSNIYSTELTIKNKLGFHVRPIQRFAELARAFACEVEVQVEDRKAPGKSVLHLMSLRGRAGAPMKITACGDDARQALCVLKFLAENRFFVEDNLDQELHPLRHLVRLSKMASCFESEIRVELNGQVVDAKRLPRLKELGLTPTSEVRFSISGEDADQARAVMENLLKYRFYIEEAMGAPSKGAK